MSYRDLQAARTAGMDALYLETLRYAHFLWQERLPARAILALARALYLPPHGFRQTMVPPYRAYRWILAHAENRGFLGNPRISFARQASRLRVADPLKRSRAWAMWHLTRVTLPGLPEDPGTEANAPETEVLVGQLDTWGHPREGRIFQEILSQKTDDGSGN